MRSPFGQAVRSWSGRALGRLSSYRPQFRDWRFWVIVGLVILIAVGHDQSETSGWLPQTALLYLLPVSLFLVPVVFAALNFGLGGAMATAGLSVIAIMPDLIQHTSEEKLGVAFQLFVVIAVAFILGHRVERERESRERAAATSAALRDSNTRYQGLLESSPLAILVLDRSGAIIEANTAASALFGRGKSSLENMLVSDLVGVDGIERLLTPLVEGRWRPRTLTIRTPGGAERILEPRLNELKDGGGNLVVQVIFRDATEDYRRQLGLQAYAAHVLRAQEEERNRISRELHDDTIQVLILLCRQLDQMAGDAESLPVAVTGQLHKARESAEELVRRLRDFARALRPPILDDLGLVTSLRRLVTDLAERNGLQGDLEVTGEERRLSSTVELGLYRIVQEALWNVEHHARADNVRVSLAFGEGKATVNVIDDGVGFRVPARGDNFAVSDQLGLISMRERAGILGGRLRIRSRPGDGTTVSVTVSDDGEGGESADPAADI
jgi:PAS domain S-box-containing protein